MHITSARRAATGAAIALAGLCAGAAPALAAPGNDGTSNTIQIAVTAPAIDQAHHRLVVTAAGAAGVLRPGQHLGSVQLVTQQLGYTFENVMVESLTGTSSRVALDFTTIRAGASGHADVSLIEEDGLYPPGA